MKCSECTYCQPRGSAIGTPDSPNVIEQEIQATLGQPAIRSEHVTVMNLFATRWSQIQFSKVCVDLGRAFGAIFSGQVVGGDAIGFSVINLRCCAGNAACVRAAEFCRFHRYNTIRLHASDKTRECKFLHG